MEIKSAWKQLLQLGGHSYLCTGTQHSGVGVPSCPSAPGILGRVWGSLGVFSIPEEQRPCPSSFVCS